MGLHLCKMCGGTVTECGEGTAVGICDYCGTKQTLLKNNNDKKMALFKNANHFRRNNEFDKAMDIYEQILNEDNTDPEIYWSLVLCNYGIEYVEDAVTHKRVPTVNRAQFTSIFDDENYKSAIQYADSEQKDLYEQEAITINEIQKGILAISQNEKPFDVFICYKESDSHGRKTPDSVLANDIYHQLTNEGFKVFFSAITLEDKLGTAYEPYIFAALNSAKVMVVLGTKPEYFNAVWVKNEWSRYLTLVKKSDGKKMLIPAYKDMDPYDLPEEFSHLQAQDMSKLGFMQDLIRGIKKIVSGDASVANNVSQNVTKSSIAPLLKRASMFLLDGDFVSANKYCERVLDIDPECAEAYLYKLMRDMEVLEESELANEYEPYLDNANYKKILMFGDEPLKNRITEYANTVAYNYAIKAMEDENYYMALPLLEEISAYKDSSERITQCKSILNEVETEYDAYLSEKKAIEKSANAKNAKRQMTENKIENSGIISIIFGVLFIFSGFCFATGSYYSMFWTLAIIGALLIIYGVKLTPYIKDNYCLTKQAEILAQRDFKMRELENKYSYTLTVWNKNHSSNNY